MTGDVPDHRASPVVADPYCLIVSEVVEQFDHVSHDVLLSERLRAFVGGRAAVAAHVRRHRTEPEAGEYWQLMTPADRQLRPTVHEHNERAILRPSQQVAGGVTVAPHGVLRRQSHAGSLAGSSGLFAGEGWRRSPTSPPLRHWRMIELASAGV